MGWQDAPVVEDKPKWSSAPEVGAPISTPSAVPSPQSKTVGGMDAFAGPEVMLNLASGGIAAPISGLAGLAGAALPGPQGQGASWVRKVGNALTYEPRTKTAETMLKPLEWAGGMLHKGAVKAGEFTQDTLGMPPSVATGVQTAIETAPAVIPMAKSLVSAKQTPAMAAKESQNKVIDATYEAARKEGYKFPPSASGGGKGNAGLESASNKNLLNQAATLNNQNITNKIAAKEAGLPPNTAITPGLLEQRRKVLAAPYREVAALDPVVAQDLVELRTARNAATKWWSYADRSGNPMAEARAKRFSDRAKTLEGYIEEAAKNAGKPDLIDRLREARTNIAKTHNVERALTEGSADVSAGTLARLLDKGVPLSGGLETIAKTHQAFRPYMGDAVNIRNPGVGSGHGYFGMAANAAGLHGGVGWFAQGVPLAGGPARSIIMSDAYQNYIGKPSYPTTPNKATTLAGLLAAGQIKEK